jgi:hypothetical protein
MKRWKKFEAEVIDSTNLNSTSKKKNVMTINKLTNKKKKKCWKWDWDNFIKVKVKKKVWRWISNKSNVEE